MHPTLTYPWNRKEMDPEPVNVPLPMVAHGLAAGHAQGVDLQPGDGTRYRLVLTPLWPLDPEFVRSTGWDEDSLAVAVTLVDDYGSTATTVAFRSPIIGQERTGQLSKNEWTVGLLTWWLNILQAQVVKLVKLDAVN